MVVNEDLDCTQRRFEVLTVSWLESSLCTTREREVGGENKRGTDGDRQRGLTSVFLQLLVPHASLKSSSASCRYCCCMPITGRDGESREVHARLAYEDQ